MNNYGIPQIPTTNFYEDAIDRFYQSNSSISDDSVLNEFMNDIDFSVPIMESVPYFESQRIRNEYHNDHFIDMDVPLHINLPRYYLFNFILCLLISITFGSTIFVSIIPINDSIKLNNDSYHQFIWWPYFTQKILQYIMFGFITYATTTPDTYKSINYSIDVLLINWILCSYPFIVMLSYLGIQLLASIIGGFIVVGLYYSKFAQINKEYILQSILSIDQQSISLSVDSFVLMIFAHVLLIIGATFIMSYINSLNCKQILIYTLSFIYTTATLYEMAVGPICFTFYKLSLYLACIMIFDIESSDSVNSTLVLIGSGMVIKLFAYPLIAYYVRYVWTRMFKQYLEYSN